MRVREAVLESTIYGGTYDDNGTMQITFDVESLATEYPEGNFELICQRDTAENPYNPEQVSVEDNKLTWTILSHDTEIVGVTECWIRVQSEEQVEKQGPYFVRFGESKSIIPEPDEQTHEGGYDND